MCVLIFFYVQLHFHRIFFSTYLHRIIMARFQSYYHEIRFCFSVSSKSFSFFLFYIGFWINVKRIFIFLRYDLE